MKTTITKQIYEIFTPKKKIKEPEITKVEIDYREKN